MKLLKKLLTSVIVFYFTHSSIFSMNFITEQESPLDSIKFVIVHDNNTTAENAWYRWMEARIKQLGFSTILHTMPGDFEEEPSLWLQYMKEILCCDRNTIIIGHAAGAQAAMLYAEENEVFGLFLIAPGKIYQVYNYADSSCFFTQSREGFSIRNNVSWIVQFSSIDDPLVPYATEALFIKEVLQPKFYACKNMHHIGDLFHTNKAIFMEMLYYLADNKILADSPALWLTINATMPDYDELCESEVRKLARTNNISPDALRYTLRHETSIIEFKDEEHG